jgi:CBS domain-containing protein
MSPRSLTEELIVEVPLLRADQDLHSAVETIIETRVPALPVVDKDGKLVGIFGEREFITAAFPGYLGELKYAAFVSKSAEEQLELRKCMSEPVSKFMNTEHVDVSSDWSDSQIAETFLHHRVLIIPVADDREVKGIVTRWDFFKAVAERLNG